uniref:Putative reverse transcriptase domain-containing protein n=1 Tax=Tanacetum cinerariifolium TaxID=118510 RepID=A0A6L2N2F9_TANCI|nr:putative reverse transcriptase domain-containing protein [Tanacetum cinerariifolium]
MSMPVYAPEPEHLEYHAPSDDDIQVKDDEEDLEEDPSEEHEPEDKDEDPGEDPNEEHELEDEDTKEPSEGFDETEPFEEDDTVVTSAPPRHHEARISVRPQTPMAASTQALINAFAVGSSLFPLPPTSPTYDQVPLGHRTSMIRMRDDIPKEDMPPRRRFVLTTPPHGPCHDTRTIARAANRVEDVGYIRALQGSERRMMTSIEEVNLRTDNRDIRLEIDVVRGQITAYETELQEVHQAYLSFKDRNRALLARLETLETHMIRTEWQRQSVEDLAVTQMMRIHTLSLELGLIWWKTPAVAAIQRNSTHTQDDATQSLDGGLKRPVQPARVCSYTDFTQCQPLNFKGIEDVVGLSQWLQKMESVFHISGCAIHNQNLWVKGNDVAAYTQRFQELALMCTKFLVDETEKVEKYISGLLDNIHGNVMPARPKTLDETIELANDLMDQKLYTYAERLNENKRKADDSLRKNQQQPYKKNGSGNGIAQGRAYALGGRDDSPDSNVIMGTLLLNNFYAKILFDTGADRSFVSTTFSALIDITPTTLENHYDVELADEKIIGVNTIIRGYTLNFMNQPFNIDLMHVPLGSFDVIIGMDWLTKYHGVIICDEKIVRVPFGREVLVFQSNRDNQKEASRLNIISCTKAQEYLSKGCDVFLAYITPKEAKDKLEGKRLEDVPIVRDFPKVFPEDLLGIPPAQQVEFQIDLVPGATPVAWAPYRLAPSEMKELAKQLQELSKK